MDKVNSITLSRVEKVYDLLPKVGDGDKEHIEPTIETFEMILENDNEIIKHIQYNSFSNKAEYVGYDNDGKSLPPVGWQDFHDSMIIAYIEKNYGINNDKKYFHAISNVIRRHCYNPVKELIERKSWDGVERIDSFLKDILQCEQDDDYLREVSRMIFYGGISRLYIPGCKFDYMPILSGEQGIGKTTIIKWLALNDSFYKEVTTIEGKEGAECIEGGWICEFAELLAMQRSKDIESMKAFITREVDKYRKAYGRHVSEIPRSCIFIGTTNEPDYLNDNTGNRRYLPLYMKLKKGEMWKNKEYIQGYIMECWRESLFKFNKGETYLTIDGEFDSIVKEEQEKATIEDLQFVSLENYLKNKPVGYRICSKEICFSVFKITENKVNNFYTRLIAKYMLKFPNWEKKAATEIPNYGNQRHWLKKFEINNKEEDDLE